MPGLRTHHSFVQPLSDPRTLSQSASTTTAGSFRVLSSSRATRFFSLRYFFRWSLYDSLRERGGPCTARGTGGKNGIIFWMLVYDSSLNIPFHIYIFLQQTLLSSTGKWHFLVWCLCHLNLTFSWRLTLRGGHCLQTCRQYFMGFDAPSATGLRMAFFPSLSPSIQHISFLLL